MHTQSFAFILTLKQIVDTYKPQVFDPHTTLYVCGLHEPSPSRIHAHAAHLLHTQQVYPVGQRRAHARERLVVARAPHLDALLVHQQPTLGIPSLRRASQVTVKAARAAHCEAAGGGGGGGGGGA